MEAFLHNFHNEAGTARACVILCGMVELAECRTLIYYVSSPLVHVYIYIYIFIMFPVLLLVHSLFQSEFSTEF